MTISKVIKQKRIEKQLTQEDIAEMLLVSKKPFLIGKMVEQYQIQKI